MVNAIMTKKTKAQSTALAKAARDSLEGLSSSEDEGKPTQRGAPSDRGHRIAKQQQQQQQQQRERHGDCSSINIESGPKSSRRNTTKSSAASQKAGYCSKTHHSKSCRS